MMPLLSSIVATRWRGASDTWAMLAIAAVILVANLPYLSGYSEADPLGPRSELVSSIVPGFDGQPTIDPSNGSVSQALGRRAALDLVHLRLPWWNPFEGTGTPLAGEMQSGAFFPPTLLTLLGNGQLYEHILLELVAGLATFGVLRRLNLGRSASVAGGIAFALNGTFAWFAHAPVNPIALLPLVLLGIEQARAAALTGRRGGWWLIAVAGAGSAYAGFPEVAYIDSVLAVLWFLCRAGSLARGDARRFLVKGAVGAVVGLLLAAPILTALIAFTSHGDLGSHGSTGFGSAHISSHGLPMLLLPYIYGPIFGYAGPAAQLTGIWGAVGGYLSTSLVMLALLGLCARGRRGLRVTLGVWVVLAVTRIYGQVPVLRDVLGWLPYMRHVAFLRYGPPSVEFATVVLAAMGLHDVVTVAQHRRRVLWVGLTMLGLIAVCVLGGHGFASELGSGYAGHHFFALAVGWGTAVVVVTTAAGIVDRPRVRASALVATVALDAVLLFGAPELSAPRAVVVDNAPSAYLAAHAGDQRFFSLGTLLPNYGSYYGVSELDIDDNPIPKLFSAYIVRRLDPYTVPTHFIGIAAGGRPPLSPSPEAELMRNLAGYRDAGVSYVLLSVHAPALPQSPTALTMVKRTPTTVIYHLAGAASFFSAPGCVVAPRGDSRVLLRCARRTTLIRRETYMPGWVADDDGAGTPIRRVDGPFQSVSIPAGTETVTFSYAPPKILWATLALTIGLAWLIVGVFRGARGAASGRDPNPHRLAPTQ